MGLAELAHANRVAMMEQLSASIVHELTHPLSGVITNTETASLWLEDEPPNLGEALRALARAARDGKRASDIVSRVQALVRNAPPQKDGVNINEGIIEIIGLTRGEAVKNRVSVRIELDESLPLIQGDRVQLQQVILNLIVNAVEASGSRQAGPREILVRTAKTDPAGILVSVADSGPRIDAANLKHVFDAFYSTKPSGLGIGLSVCRSIIEAHGGRLWTDANALGGADFQFTVPVMMTESCIRKDSAA